MKSTLIIAFLQCAGLICSTSQQTISIQDLCDICVCTFSNVTTNNQTSVNCARQDIYEISEGMTVPEDIDVLDLTNNNLKYPSITPGGRKVRARQLLLARNRIERVAEPDFYHLEGLQNLDLSYNKIVQITGRPFIYVKQLKKLDLSGNILRGLPEGVFSSLSELQDLSLSLNPLHSLGKNVVSELPSLILLDLAKTALSNIHRDAFKGCKNLQFVDLSWNNIEVIPTRAFEITDQLESLKLTGNPIRIIDERSFWFPTGLLEIFLDQMPELREVRAKAFSRQSSLETVIISRNKKLSKVDAKAFQGAHSLSKIDLSRNQLSNVENGEALAVLCADTQVNLEENRWYCDCNFKWILPCSSSLNNSLGTCMEPNSMEGFEIRLLTEQQLICGDDIWLTGIGHLDKRMGLALFSLGVAGVFVSLIGIYMLVKHKPRITWNRRVKDKNEDLHYVRMHDRDPEKIQPRRY